MKSSHEHNIRMRHVRRKLQQKMQPDDELKF